MPSNKPARLQEQMARIVRVIGFAVAAAVILSKMVAAQPYAFGVGAFGVAQGPTAIVTADFNGDGRLDLAVTAGNSVSILLGRPDGSFAQHQDYSVGEFGPTAMAVGDFNGDGKLDIITAVGPEYPSYEVLLGNGDGTFQPATNSFLPTSIGLTGVTVGDFNKDGKVDIALASNQFSGPVVSVLIGNGNGTFGKEVDYATGGSFSVITGDFNGDGNIDLAVGNGYVGDQNSLSILLGNGDGTFKPYQAVLVPGSGNDSLAAADFNHDGKLDLVVASAYYNPGGVFVLLGNGDGTFASAVSYPGGDATNAVAIGDFDGDGKPDIAATNYDGFNLSVWLGKGDGTFESAQYYPASLYPIGLVAGDFNGDGIQDIVSVAGYLSSSAATVLIGRGDGTFAGHANQTILNYPYNMAAGDFNGDGKADLAVDSFANPGAVSILLGNGKGHFSVHKDTKVGSWPSYLIGGDFNRDGALDVAVIGVDSVGGTAELSTLLGDGNGKLQAPRNQTISSIPYGKLATSDFDLDGNLDLAMCPGAATGVSVFFGVGDGTFSSPAVFGVGDTCGATFAADFNGDHKPDLVVTTYSGVSILLGEGTHSFQLYSPVLAGYAVQGVGDFNGDGITDLAVSAGPPFVGIALGNGDGTFQAPQTVYVPTSVNQTVVGDFNGDGKLDLAFIDQSGMTLSILTGNGDGTLGQRIDLPTENSPESMAAADLTGDGGLDIAVASAGFRSTGTLSVYSNHPVSALYPSSLTFGSQKIGTSSGALNTTLYNSGGAPLLISAVTTKGDYSQTNNCGASLAVRSFCTVSITFKPKKAGSRGGSLLVKDSATTRPQTIILGGTGLK